MSWSVRRHHRVVLLRQAPLKPLPEHCGLQILGISFKSYVSQDLTLRLQAYSYQALKMNGPKKLRKVRGKFAEMHLGTPHWARQLSRQQTGCRRRQRARKIIIIPCFLPLRAALSDVPADLRRIYRRLRLHLVTTPLQSSTPKKKKKNLATPPYPHRSAASGRFLPRPRQPTPDLSDESSVTLSPIFSTHGGITPLTPETSPAPAPDPTALHAALASILAVPPPLDSMTELNPKLFKGDGLGENATDFLNAIHRRNLVSPTWKDAEKLEFFELSLKSGSYVKSWYNKLAATDKDTFPHLVVAFQKQWPEKEMAVREKGELQEELLSLKLRPEEIGVRVEEDGIEEWGQVHWAVKVAAIAARIEDDGRLIPQVLKNIPDSLLLRLGPKCKTWAELVQTMKDIPSSDVAGVRRLEDRLASMETLISNLQRAPPQTPTRGLTTAFSSLAASSPVRNDPNRRLLFPQASAAAAPVACNYRTDSERLVMIQAAPVTIQPRTPAGQATYAREIATYAQKHGTLRPSEERPYPLTPGTVAVGSGECHKCGTMGHFSAGCSATDSLLILAVEVRWRQIVQSIRTRAARTAEAIPVCIVADADDNVFGTAEYDNAVIQDGRAVHLSEHGMARAREEGGEGVPERAEEPLGDVVRQPHAHTLGRGEGASPPDDVAAVIPDAHVPVYNQSHIIDLYSVGSRERKRKSVPFIQKVLLRTDSGGEMEVETVVDDGAMAGVLDVDAYEAARQILGELAWSPRVLRMANGELVPSMGSWTGEVNLGGVARRGTLEIFPSGGAWTMLLGKPLLEVFGAWHGYEEDVILLRGERGEIVRVANTHVGSQGKASPVMTMMVAATRATISGGSRAPPARQAPPIADSAAVERIDQPGPTDVSAPEAGNEVSARTSNWWRAGGPRMASIMATRETIMGGDDAPPTRQVPEPVSLLPGNPDEHPVTGEEKAPADDLPARTASETKAREAQTSVGRHVKRQRSGRRERERKSAVARDSAARKQGVTPSGDLAGAGRKGRIERSVEEGDRGAEGGEAAEWGGAGAGRGGGAEARAWLTVLVGKSGAAGRKWTKEEKTAWRRMRALGSDGHVPSRATNSEGDSRTPSREVPPHIDLIAFNETTSCIQARGPQQEMAESIPN
ncbi:hypothetical protein FB451DRAFT_1379095 [Mycena latifolia]|nr:hypothetical protein FB451DRAFT_1379095 [Mycena latifolia]